MKQAAGAAAHYAENILQGGVVADERTVQAGTVASKIASNDPERVLTLVYNLSSSEVTVSFRTDVGVGSGIILAPNGGYLRVDVSEDFVLATHAIYAVAGSNNRDLLVITMRREYQVEGVE